MVPVATNIAPQSPINQHIDSGLTDNTTYYYMLSAENSSGNGTLSNEAQATPPAGTTPEFIITALPNNLTIPQGQNDSTTISVDDLGGFSTDIALSITGVPANVTTSFYPPVATSSGSTLFFMIGASATPGTYTLSVTGTAGSLHSHDQSPPDRCRLRLAVSDQGKAVGAGPMVVACVSSCRHPAHRSDIARTPAADSPAFGQSSALDGRRRGEDGRRLQALVKFQSR